MMDGWRQDVRKTLSVEPIGRFYPYRSDGAPDAVTRENSRGV